MRSFFPFPPSRAAGARSPDWLWGGLGVTMASASASFAAYMIATAPSQVVDTGSKDFGVFAQFDHRFARPAETAAAGTTDPARPRAAPGIDPTPTGSIAHDTAEGRVSRMPRFRNATPLSDFVVRDVVGNKALIEHRQKLSLVRPGSILDGAGEVLAIERRGDAWVVKTATGEIGGL